MRRHVLLLAAVLVAIPAGSASAAETTGRLLVTLHRSVGSPAARAAAFDAVAASAGALRAGFSVPKLRLVTVRPRRGESLSSLACGAGENGGGLTGAGLRCRLLAISSDFSDSSVAAAIVWAVDHGADAINMSFGTSPDVHPTQPVIEAIDYAFAHNVVMVSAA